MSCDSLDEVYEDVYEAFEEKFETLVTKLKDSVQYDELSTMRKKLMRLLRNLRPSRRYCRRELLMNPIQIISVYYRNLMMLMELLCQNRMSIKKLTRRLEPVYRKKCLTVEFLELSN
jgi:hypothetical protein